MDGGIFTISARTLSTRNPSAQGLRAPFRDFVAADENALVRHFTGALERSETGATILVLHGATGTGKSLLAGNLVDRWNFQSTKGRAIYWTGSDFARAVTDAIDTDSLLDFRFKLSQARFVVIDGLEELLRKSMAQHELSLLLDQAAENETRVLLTCRRLPAEVTGLSPRLISRLMSGLCIPITTPGPMARRVLLVRFAEAYGVTFTETAIDALADGLPGLLPASSTILEMNHVVVRLSQLAQGERREVGIEQLRGCVAVPNSELDRVQAICQEVARAFGVRAAELASPSRRQGIVRVRGVAMFLCRQLTALSLEAIGARFGGRDHTTVMHACRKAEELLATDASIRGLVEKLLEQFSR